MSRSRSRIMLALLLGAAMPGSIAHAQPAPVPQESLRIATYNAYLLSPIFKCLGPQALAVVPLADCLAQISGQTESWAEHLADAILADRANIDIIAINEAWDEDAKEILRNRLSVEYPVQITKIDKSLIDVRAEILADVPQEFAIAGEVRFNGEDSGLMLFAKRDFQVLPLPNPVFKWGSNPGETLKATTDQVGFTWFEDCSAEDCFAAKGAALIRLRHGARGPIYNVVLTHLQADYPADGELYVGTRDRQFRAIRRLIEKTLDPLSAHDDGRSAVILLGDLNVPYLLSRDEWDKRFDRPESFFRNPLYESFHHTSSRDDKVATNNTDRERLDYILASPRPASNEASAIRQRCVQHVTVPIRFRDLESDHNMVHADINRGFFHCSPAIAYRVELNASGTAILDRDPANTTVDVTQISTPGSMQWFEVKAQGTGTYSIGPDTLDVKVDVFLPEDLTTPVSRYNKTPGALPPSIRKNFATNQYVLPDRFFIRTSGRTRFLAANYALLVRRHSCSSKADACLLKPGTLQEATLSGQNLAPGQLTYQDEAWFRFDAVGQATSGKPQTITLTAAISDEPRVSSRIEDFSDPLGGTLTESAMTNIRGYTGKIGDGGKGYVLIKQSSRAPNTTNLKVAFDTDLRFIRIGNLTCIDETNPELGSDDIFTRVDIDGDVRRAPNSGYVEFDCDDNQDAKNWATRIGGSATKAFLGKFAMRVIEEDDVSPNDNASLRTVSALADGEIERKGAILEWSFEDGEYQFDYDLMRRLNAPVADP